MGIYIKNADRQIGNSHNNAVSSNQKELLRILGEIWNNQDFLNEEDKQILIKLSQKGLY